MTAGEEFVAAVEELYELAEHEQRLVRLAAGALDRALAAEQEVAAHIAATGSVTDGRRPHPATIVARDSARLFELLTRAASLPVDPTGASGGAFGRRWLVARFKRTAQGQEGVHPLEKELEELVGVPEPHPPALLRAPVGWSPVPRCHSCDVELEADRPYVYIWPEGQSYHADCPIPKVYFERDTTPWPETRS